MLLLSRTKRREEITWKCNLTLSPILNAHTIFENYYLFGCFVSKLANLNDLNIDLVLASITWYIGFYAALILPFERSVHTLFQDNFNNFLAVWVERIIQVINNFPTKCCSIIEFMFSFVLFDLAPQHDNLLLFLDKKKQKQIKK